MPAPVKGLNTRSNIANMDPEFATVMENFFPSPADCRVRKGYDQYCTGFMGPVETLASYNAADGSSKLFAWNALSIYEVVGGAVGAPEVTGLINTQWYTTNFANSVGTAYLMCFNEADEPPQYYDGTAWQAITDVTTPGITGVPVNELVYAFTHKRRVFLVRKDSLSLYYLPVDSVGGAAASLPLQGIANKGGYIVAGGTWTLDSGSGPDDFMFVITSEGQIVVYQGSDPLSYSLVGTYDVGEPVGRRCVHKYRGDNLLLLREGIFPLTQAIQSVQVDPEASLTYEIQPTITQAVRLYGDNYGWRLIHYPEENMVILNIPVGAGQRQIQYAMNTITGAWGGPFNIESNCFCLSNKQMYFGGNGFVGRYYFSKSDNGANIEAEIRPAYSYLGQRGIEKQVKSVRPNFLCDGVPNVLIGINTDYQDQNIVGNIQFSAPNFGTWDDAIWDQANWGGQANFLGEWLTVRNNPAMALAPRIKITTAGVELRYDAIDILFETGAIVG